MIYDDDAKQLYLSTREITDEPWEPRKKGAYQIFRGKGWPIIKNRQLVTCVRHKFVFNKYNIIPKYCFDCYKVVIMPRNIVELFKLMMLFGKHDFPIDNTRKCMIAPKKAASTPYKGFIYCLSIAEGREVLNVTQKVVSEEISENIPIILKRGCSEYALAYPRFPKVGQGATAMKYKTKWKKYEDIVNKEIGIPDTLNSVTNEFNRPDFASQEIHIMHYWLQFAATIGDTSYQKITDCTLQPNPDIKCTGSFNQ